MHRKTILVLGMHRSGTSALARILSLLGCDLPHTIMPETLFNPKGHWESNAIMALNDAVLQSAGSSWDDWLELNPAWYASPVVDDFLQRASAILTEEYGTSPLFMLKDPRNCRLTRFWLDVLSRTNVDPLVVIPLRNPLEVAASLEACDGMHRNLAMLLWLRNVLDAEHGSRGCRRVFVSFESLLDDWVDVAERMQDALAITWPRFSVCTAMDVEAFLDLEIPHHVQHVQGSQSTLVLSEWVRDTDAILRQWVAAGENPDDFAALDTIRQQLNVAGPAFAKLTYAVSSERQQSLELRALLQAKEGELAQLKSEILVLQEQSLVERHLGQEDIEQLRQELLDRQHELSNVQSTLRQREEEVAQTLSDLHDECQKATRAEDERVAAEGRLKIVEGKLKDADEWVFRLAGDRKASEERVALAVSRLAAAQLALSRASAQLSDVRGQHHLNQMEKTSLLGEIGKLTALVKDQGIQGEEAKQRWTATQSEIVLLSKLLKQQEAELASTTSPDEFAHLSNMLKAKGEAADQNARRAEWLQQVTAVVTGYPHWWAFVPKKMREKWKYGRLLRRKLFDANAYLARYPDVSSSGLDPLRHYIMHGIGEKRSF